MKLTMDEHGELVRELLAKGASYREIGRQLGVSKDTAAVFCKVTFPETRRIPSQAVYQEAPEVRHVDGEVLKLLVIDIETFPSLAYVWDVWKQNIHPRQLVDEKTVASFAAKWVGDDEVMFYSLHHHGKEAMVKAAWELLDEADGVIHYNGKKFDVPHLNREFLEAGMRPPSTFRQIDLLTTVRSEFSFTHNKLDHVAAKLGIGRKVEHEGFDLWLKCMAGDAAAWERMAEYNMHDVRLTEELYGRVRPWIKQHPSFAVAMREFVCPTCGSPNLHPTGESYTKSRAYKRYVCEDCGAASRDTHNTHSSDITGTTSW